jgi:hypothetical protein
MEALTLKPEPTSELAKHWANVGTSILFDGTDPFQSTVSKEKLEQNLYNQILINILEHETSDLSEEQFRKCVELSKIN